MCTLAESYGCVALVHERVVVCVPVYCATHCIVPGFAGVCATNFEAPALCVRSPCATAVLPLHERVILYVPVYCSRVCVPLTSRDLLCVYVSRVLRLCCLVHERVVRCVPMYCATHCTVPGIRGRVRHLLRGTCSVCTLAKCYGCAALCMNVSYYVYLCTVLPIA